MTAHVEKAAYVGVGDSARQEHFAFQAPVGSIIGSQVLRQNFQRNPLVQKLVIDFVDLPHSTAAQQTPDVVPIGEAHSGSQARRCRAANPGPWRHRLDGRGFIGNRAGCAPHQQCNRSSTRLALINVPVEALNPGGTELSAAEGEESGFGRAGRKHHCEVQPSSIIRQGDVDPELRDEADSRRAALVRLVLAEGREAFPTVSLAEATLAQCLLTPDEEVSPDLVTSHARDMFLAAACGAGDAAALSILEGGPLREIPDFVARIDTGPDFAAEVAQIVRQKLLVAPAPGQPGKIAEYRGAGPLGGWIRVIAVRVALDLKRAQSSPGGAHRDPIDIAAAGADPEIALLRDLYRDAFRNALHAALAELSGRERNLLRFHFADGLTLDELATSYRVHRATIARWLARARRDLLERTRQQLALAVGASGAEVDSIVRVLGSELDVSLSKLG